MDKSAIQATIESERRAFADDLKTTTKWDEASLCDGWTVQEVVEHMTATCGVTPMNFFPRLVASGFSLTKLQAKDLAKVHGRSGEATLAAFEAVIPSTKRPPGPIQTMLGETLVHSEDVRRPLGITHAYPVDAVVEICDFFKNSNLIIGSKRRIEGVTLVATDADWKTGTGPTVEGPIQALLMAMTGRKAALGDLTGDGVATLESR